MFNYISLGLLMYILGFFIILDDIKKIYDVLWEDLLRPLMLFGIWCGTMGLVIIFTYNGSVNHEIGMLYFIFLMDIFLYLFILVLSFKGCKRCFNFLYSLLDPNIKKKLKLS